MEHNNKFNNQNGKVAAGVVILLIGAALLLNNLFPQIPNWIFSWSTFLIALGFIIGLKENFRGGKGIILIIIGSFFTLRKVFSEYDFDKVGWPILFVVIGLFLIFKPKFSFRNRSVPGSEAMDNKSSEFQNYNPNQLNETNAEFTGETITTNYIDSVNVFGGSHQIIYSKNFKGGEIVAVFGGCDINLTQADFNGVAQLEVTAIFGGAKIIVPAGWKIKHEVTAIFGGFDDKRVIATSEGSNKLLIVKGIALFGGVEIKSY